ncbi:MAG: hypothetical protein JRG91_16610, partial [Deltaproteobacteria bacterium]|nr:hypothetical protein [Deltaproteobacteria bacterium]
TLAADTYSVALDGYYGGYTGDYVLNVSGLQKIPDIPKVMRMSPLQGGWPFGRVERSWGGP